MKWRIDLNRTLFLGQEFFMAFYEQRGGGSLDDQFSGGFGAPMGSQLA